jgi:hypothetical protein
MPRLALNRIREVLAQSGVDIDFHLIVAGRHDPTRAIEIVR